jgi:hypothetical protein
MDRKSVDLFLIASVFVLLLFSLQGCSDMGYQPQGDYISGWVTFTDTALMPGGYYAISMYANKPNPFDTLPLKSDSLKLELDYSVYKAYYRLSNEIKDSYFFAVTWHEYPVLPYLVPPVLGSWGCDTDRTCTAHKVISFPNYTGASYNILCWTDTSKKLN